MKKKKSEDLTQTHNSTRYLMEDLLVMKTPLNVRERNHLMKKIDAEAVEDTHLKTQPAFWMGDKILLVLNQSPAECWFYYTNSGKLDKVHMSGLISSFCQGI